MCEAQAGRGGGGVVMERLLAAGVADGKGLLLCYGSA